MTTELSEERSLFSIGTPLFELPLLVKGIRKGTNIECIKNKEFQR